MQFEIILLVAIIIIGVEFVVAGLIGLDLLLTRRGKQNEPPSTSINKIDHSQQVLDFIRMIVSGQAKLKFNEFKDGHDMSKITKINIEHLVADVAHGVNDALDESRLDLDVTVFTHDFYIKYIIDMSTYAVKNLLEDAIDNVNSNEGVY